MLFFEHAAPKLAVVYKLAGRELGFIDSQKPREASLLFGEAFSRNATGRWPGRLTPESPGVAWGRRAEA